MAQASSTPVLASSRPSRRELRLFPSATEELQVGACNVNNNQFSHFQRKDKQEQVLKTFLGAVFIVFVEEKVLRRLWAERQSCDLEDCRHCRDRQQPGPAMEVTVIAKNNIVKLVKYCRILCSLTNRQGCRADCPCREPANNTLSNCCCPPESTSPAAIS